MDWVNTEQHNQIIQCSVPIKLHARTQNPIHSSYTVYILVNTGIVLIVFLNWNEGLASYGQSSIDSAPISFYSYTNLPEIKRPFGMKNVWIHIKWIDFFSSRNRNDIFKKMGALFSFFSSFLIVFFCSFSFVIHVPSTEFDEESIIDFQ